MDNARTYSRGTRTTAMPNTMEIRSQTAENPHSALKACIGAAYSLTRNLTKVRTEMSMYVPIFIMKRLIQIFGVQRLSAAIRTQGSRPV